MILSDREIRAAVARGAVRITPDPAPEAWSSTALDLRLAKVLTVWQSPGGKGMQAIICPFDPEFVFKEILQRHGQSIEMVTGAGHVLKSGSFVLGWTIEKLQLPYRSRLAARVEGKSSLARFGLGVHVTAPTIHAGFGSTKDQPDFLGSPLQLEIWNVGPFDIKLEEGMPICQLIFEIVDGTPEKGYEGRFSVQGPA